MSGDSKSGQRSIGDVFAAAAAAVARGDDLDDQLAQLLGLAAEHLGAGMAAMFIADQDRDELELTVVLGVDEEAAEKAGAVGRASESKEPLADAWRLRKPMELEDAGTVPVLRGAGTGLLLPMVVRRDGIEICLGVMALGFSGGLPGAAERATAEALADLGAVTVERSLAIALGAERAEWFDRLAHTDPLTGLPNRRTVDRLLELEVARAGRQGTPISLGLFEVDRFPEIVKAGGNAAGDDVLRRVAQILSESVRLVDSVGRFANDQFILIAPGAEGEIVAQRLVRSIAGLPPVNGKAVSVSAGIAGFPMDGRAPDDLLAAAGKAMAAARAAGGDRVVAQG